MELIIQRVKHRLASKGPKGFLGFARQFKLMDLDNDQRISSIEFKKAIRDYRIEVTDYEIDALFKMFDRDSNQLIDYDEFLIFLQV